MHNPNQTPKPYPEALNPDAVSTEDAVLADLHAVHVLEFQNLVEADPVFQKDFSGLSTTKP